MIILYIILLIIYSNLSILANKNYIYLNLGVTSCCTPYYITIGWAFHAISILFFLGLSILPLFTDSLHWVCSFIVIVLSRVTLYFAKVLCANKLDSSTSYIDSILQMKRK